MTARYDHYLYNSLLELGEYNLIVERHGRRRKSGETGFQVALRRQRRQQGTTTGRSSNRKTQEFCELGDNSSRAQVDAPASDVFTNDDLGRGQVIAGRRSAAARNRAVRLRFFWASHGGKRFCDSR